MKRSEEIKEKAMACALELRSLGVLVPDKDVSRIIELWMLRAVVDSGLRSRKRSVWEKIFGHDNWIGGRP